jgi:hypothetical protein
MRDDKANMSQSHVPRSQVAASYASVETSVQAASRRRTAAPYRARWSSWLLSRWHLLSLDAPTVAAVWTWFVARAFHVRLPWTDVAAMFVAVWMLYAADRMLDGLVLDEDPQAGGLEARHLFHHLFHDFFRWGIVNGFVVLICLVAVMNRLEVRLYVALGVLLAGWFVLIHRSGRPLPKELAVGLFFALALCVPTASRLGTGWLQLWVPALVIGILCSLNCLFLYAWEHENGSQAVAHGFIELAARGLVPLSLCAVGAAGCLVPLVNATARPVVIAAALALGLLMLLHGLRLRIASTTLRALADFVLLTPLLLGMWVR